MVAFGILRLSFWEKFRRQNRQSCSCAKKNDDSASTSMLVNCGIPATLVKIDRLLPPKVRVTVQLDEQEYNSKTPRGKVVSPQAPRQDNGTYWGYTTRLASSLKAVFDECPYKGGYDLKIGTSERGDCIVTDAKFSLPKFDHALIVFGGVAGIEECVDADESMKLPGSQTKQLFDMWVNTCPLQGSRTIRTEEAILISLSTLSPFIASNTGTEANDGAAPTEPTVEFSEEDLSDESSDSD